MQATVSDFKSQISNVGPGPQHPARSPFPDTRHPAPDTCSSPRFIATLDAGAAAANHLVRVPLAVTGKWMRGTAPFAITRRDLEEIVRNFRERQNGEINVDYDHASEMPEVAAGGPVPSAGRIVKLDPPEGLGTRDWGLGKSNPRTQHLVPSPQPLAPSTRFILWGWFEPTERARALLKNREYRFISPAIDWAARSKSTGRPQGTTLTSVALTNRPFLEELPQIRLSDPAYRPVEETEHRKTKSEIRKATDDVAAAFRPPCRAEARRYSTNFDFRISRTGGIMKQVNLSIEDGKIKLAHEDFQDEYFVSPEEMKKALKAIGLEPEAMLAAAFSELGIEPGARAGQEINLTQAGALLSEAEASGKSIPAVDFFRARVEQELDEAVRSGKVLPRQRDDWRKMALADFPTFRKIVGAQKTQVPLRPVGFSGAGPADVQSQVKFLAEQRMRERGVTFGQALSDIGREQPDLVQQYRRAVSSE